MEIKLPTYKMTLADEGDGIVCISLVDDPAVMSDFVAFSSDKVQFAKDELKHNILGVVMRADFPIYRSAGYYVEYPKEVVEQMLLKMMKDNTYKNISVMHNGELIKGVSLQEVFLKDSAKGVSPIGFENIEEGSMFAVYHIEDEGLWNSIMEGDFKGFSLEGWFTKQEVKLQNELNKTKNINNMFEKLKSLFESNFKKVSTEEGIDIYFDGEELAVGMEVADADMNPIADGEYHTDAKVIVIKDNKVESIDDKPIEEPKEEEMKKDYVENGYNRTASLTPREIKPSVAKVKADDDVEDTVIENDAEIEALKASIAEHQALIDELKKQIEEIKAMLAEPAAPRIQEDFSKQSPRKNEKRFFD